MVFNMLIGLMVLSMCSRYTGLCMHFYRKADSRRNTTSARISGEITTGFSYTKQSDPTSGEHWPR